MPLEVLQPAVLQRPLVGCLEHNARSLAGCEGLLPAGGAQTPAIAGLEAGELEFRHRRAEVIAAGLGEVQELSSHQHADGVRAAILSARVAAAVAEEACQWALGAICQLAAQDIACLLAHRRLRCSAPSPAI